MKTLSEFLFLASLFLAMTTPMVGATAAALGILGIALACVMSMLARP